jgi:hypothetical protein
MPRLRIFIGLLCVIAVGLIAAAILDYGSRTTKFSQRTSCVANQVQIDLSKAVLADENGWTNGYVVPAGLVWQSLGKLRICPLGGTYSINPVGERSSCSYTGVVRWKRLRWPRLFSHGSSDDDDNAGEARF